jgi:hypothetical protein
MKRNSIIALVLVAGAVAVALAVWAVKYFTADADTERAMATYRAQPLVGLVLADNPAVEAELRGAIEQDQSHPQPGRSRVFDTIAKLRQTVIAPTVAAADTASALAVMKARVALVGYLQKHDLVACRQFAAAGIQDISKLDDEGQRLFRATLAAMEAAYRNGKANGGKGPLPSAEEFRAMLQTAGFTDDDFAKLRDAATLKDADLCALELRIDEAPDKLADDKRGPFARFVIAH